MVNNEDTIYIENNICRELTIDEKNKINKHMKRYNVENICAYYLNMEDFFEDWELIGVKRTDARKILHGGIGEFQIIKNLGIIRYVI